MAIKPYPDSIKPNKAFDPLDGGTSHYAVRTDDPRVAGIPGEAVADLADPSSATAEDVALALNDLLASLRTAGLIAEDVS